MAVGKVKWFNDAKGFGFIETAAGKDIFVHYTAISPGSLSTARKTLQPGQEVEFDIYENEKGSAAQNVVQRDH